MSTDLSSLFAQHGPALLGYLARRVDDPEDAADLLSETFLIAWRRRSALPSSPGDRPWLYGVARHVLANQRRATRRRNAATQALADLVLQVTTPAPETSIDVRRALDMLDPLDREIVTLSAWEALTSGEIAQIVQLPPSTVRARHARARAVIRACLVIEHTGSDSTGPRIHM